MKTVNYFDSKDVIKTMEVGDEIFVPFTTFPEEANTKSWPGNETLVICEGAFFLVKCKTDGVYHERVSEPVADALMKKSKKNSGMVLETFDTITPQILKKKMMDLEMGSVLTVPWQLLKTAGFEQAPFGGFSSIYKSEGLLWRVDTSDAENMVFTRINEAVAEELINMPNFVKVPQEF